MKKAGTVKTAPAYRSIAQWMRRELIAVVVEIAARTTRTVCTTVIERAAARTGTAIVAAIRTRGFRDDCGSSGSAQDADRSVAATMPTMTTMPPADLMNRGALDGSSLADGRRSAPKRTGGAGGAHGNKRKAQRGHCNGKNLFHLTVRSFGCRMFT